MSIAKLLGLLLSLGGAAYGAYRAWKSRAEASHDRDVALANETSERARVDQMTAAEESARQTREKRLDEKVTSVRSAAGAARLLRDVSDDSQVN